MFVFLWRIVWKTFQDLHCQYSSSQAILKLSQIVRGHFVMLTEVSLDFERLKKCFWGFGVATYQ